ncbi:SAICAR synthase-like protein [Spinellus fusiger]|nr:SAICAR synthase-like protein [Spinellus fusiger]
MSSLATPLRHTTPDLGDLDSEEREALEAEILARRVARRVSRKNTGLEEEEEEEEDRVFIGTRVAEGHPNYQLMYDMLTGIRIAVGRVSAKIRRDLTQEDFSAAHKLVFDVTGTELTPGVKYDFKFKDYAPWVFRILREKFHIDAADYMMSLTNKYILSELGSPGKSGSFFYYSRDYRFIIKTIHHSEHKFMRKVLKDYYQHVCKNPNTLLCRFYGLYRIKLPHGRKIHFVVMSNVFPANKDIHETYDLKGSTFGRRTSDEEIIKNPHAVMKDQNWVQRNKTLELGPSKRHLFITQLERDIELLKTLNIMDYSLLIGIHDLQRGNREGIRDHRLHIVKPDTRYLDRESSHRTHKRENKATMVRKALKSINPVQLNSSELPGSPSEERRYCVFYAEEGGFFSTGEQDEFLDNIYFVGVIDILTPYNLLKRTEHLWKSLTQDKHTISAVHPLEYGARFMHFMKKSVTRGESSKDK